MPSPSQRGGGDDFPGEDMQYLLLRGSSVMEFCLLEELGKHLYLKVVLCIHSECPSSRPMQYNLAIS